MLIIRLQRTGRKNASDFRIVLAEKHRAASKKVQVVFGQYNPRAKSFHLGSGEKLKTWISRGVELSPTVRNLLISKNIISGAKVKAWQPKKKEKAATPSAVADAQAPEAPTASEPTKTEAPTEAPAAV